MNVDRAIRVFCIFLGLDNGGVRQFGMKLKVELLGQSCTGTVTVSGFDNLETHIESLNYDGPRAFITDYFYTTLVSIKPEGFDEFYPPRLVISLVDDYNHEIKA